ncbi:hypothetical protein L596_013606 [Steinernema carpocapsae]|uniref:Aldehyde dehydrogenase domain-containing protein n=1 Tax=Steinernema carpocapsae TaxID=34508 RepID=A0A4U5P1I6_STECR|nr:hypothetical protein L596_013606 [Steinernema carpocapsae]
MMRCQAREKAPSWSREAYAGGIKTFLQPIIFTNVGDQMKITQEKISGPVMSVIRFDGKEDLVEKAYHTIYGFAASVIIKDLDKALHVSNHIRARTVCECMATMSPGRPGE